MTLAERTDRAIAWIDAQLALCNAATAGPWMAQDDSLHESWTVRARGMYVCGTRTNTGIGGTTAIGEPDAAFIAAARTGYPAMLESMKLAIESILEVAKYNSGNGCCDYGCDTPTIAALSLETILTRIEALQ